MPKLSIKRVYIPDEKWIPVMALLDEILNSTVDIIQSDILIISKESSFELIEKSFGGHNPSNDGEETG